jgi:HSP20 family molecular chaperone IbpA
LAEGARIEEKNERALVEISKAGEQQLNAAKKLNTERLHAIDDNSKKAYEQLAVTTAEELKRAEGRAAGVLDAHRISSTERLKYLVDRSEDSFYRIKTLSPLLREEEGAYTVQVSLPPHEAENLLVSSAGHSVNLALSRRFQDKVDNAEGATRTNSFQSIVEQIAMPGPYEAGKISRKYEDGVLTIRVPKAVTPGPHETKS